jgi:O-methyltransferase involved in polyketide biosynthesis
MDKSLKEMLDVSSTMLITLYARAKESSNVNPIIQDKKAVEIIDIVKREIVGSNNPIHKKIISGKYNAKLAVAMALRSRRFDKYVLDFIKYNPNGTVINFGCGLDTRFDRIDNGTIRWFDIDFPEVIELRRRFLKENDRHTFLEGSMLDSFWINKIKTGGPYLILAEGVFMYLEEDNIKQLFEMINREFGRVDLVCEVTNSFWVKRMKSRYMQWKFKHQLGMTGGAVFTFGIPYSEYFEEWDKHYKFIDDWTYFDDKEKKLGLLSLFSKIEVLRKVQWTVHYRLGA